MCPSSDTSMVRPPHRMTQDTHHPETSTAIAPGVNGTRTKSAACAALQGATMSRRGYSLILQSVIISSFHPIEGALPTKSILSSGCTNSKTECQGHVRLEKPQVSGFSLRVHHIMLRMKNWQTNNLSVCALGKEE